MSGAADAGARDLVALCRSTIRRLLLRVAIVDHGRLIDAGTPAALVARHLSGADDIVSTRGPAALERFQGIKQIQSVTHQGVQFTIVGHGEEVVTEVIDCLAEHRMTG